MYCGRRAAQAVTLCQSSTTVGLKTKCLPLLFCPFYQDCKHKDIWENRGTVQLELLAEQGFENVNCIAGAETKKSAQRQPYRFFWECLMLESWADCAAKERVVLHGGICRAGTVVQLSAELRLWSYCLYFRARARGKGLEVQWQWVCLGDGRTLSKGSPNNRTGRCWRLWFHLMVSDILFMATPQRLGI